MAVNEFSRKTVTIIDVPRNGMMLFSMFSIDIFICFQCSALISLPVFNVDDESFECDDGLKMNWSGR